MNKIFIFLTLLLPMQTWAYVYPPNFVYENWIQNGKQVSTLTYEKVYQAIDITGQAGSVEKIEKVMIKRPGLVRILDEKNNIEMRVDSQRAVLITQGQKRKITIDQAMGPLEMLWAYNNADALMVRVNQFYTSVSQFQWFLFNGEKHWLQGKKEDAFLLFSTEPYLPKMAKQGHAIYQFMYKADQGAKSLLPIKIIQFESQTPKYEVLIQNLRLNQNFASNVFSTT
ncbi:MAG: hypothetical protein R3A45_05400 [Bdellovibrionota bacterium]